MFPTTFFFHSRSPDQTSACVNGIPNASITSMSKIKIDMQRKCKRLNGAFFSAFFCFFFCNRRTMHMIVNAICLRHILMNFFSNARFSLFGARTFSRFCPTSFGFCRRRCRVSGTVDVLQHVSYARKIHGEKLHLLIH